MVYHISQVPVHPNEVNYSPSLSMPDLKEVIAICIQANGIPLKAWFTENISTISPPTKSIISCLLFLVASVDKNTLAESPLQI
jgi:hypothetical protein